MPYFPKHISCSVSYTHLDVYKRQPLRHFVWNIAERLGKRDYTMAMRIAFVKALFPKPFEGLEDVYKRQSITHPVKDTITMSLVAFFLKN